MECQFKNQYTNECTFKNSNGNYKRLPKCQWKTFTKCPYYQSHMEKYLTKSQEVKQNGNTNNNNKLA
jgi:hypothetical protein